MKRTLITVVGLLLFTWHAQAAAVTAPLPAQFLPLIVNPITPTAVPLPTIAPNATPTLPPVSFSSCAVDPGSAINYPILIVTVDKVAETVTLRNVSTSNVDLTGWRMCSITGGQTHDGVSGVLAPGATQIYSHSGSSTIWNNFLSDPGALYTTDGRLVSYWPN
jgi:hypothetical protein